MHNLKSGNNVNKEFSFTTWSLAEIMLKYEMSAFLFKSFAKQYKTDSLNTVFFNGGPL